MRTQVLSAQAPNMLERALAVLEHGGLIAFPTDTVYGVGAAIFDEQAAGGLYQVKGRPDEKAIPVLLPNAEALTVVAQDLDARAHQLAAAFWPGPLTIVVPKAAGLPEAVTPLPTVGVRVPDHPVALRLLNAAGPLAVTSANRSGAENSQTAEDVMRHLGGKIELIVDGGTCPGGQPSTVITFDKDEIKILRPGPLTKCDLIEALS